jgi:hypothetical protein
METSKGSLRELVATSNGIDVGTGFALPAQDALSRTIATVRPMNSRILFGIPLLRDCRFGLALVSWAILYPGLYLALLGFFAYPIKMEHLIEVLLLTILALLGFACVHIGYDRLRENRSSLTRLLADPKDCSSRLLKNGMACLAVA